MLNLDGKVALITGAGSGQGRAAALLFARQGAAVAVAEMNAEAGAEVADEVSSSGGRAISVVCDVSQADQVEDAVKRTAADLGGLDILYNNAGVWYAAGGDYRPGITDGPSPLLESNIWERTIDVNLKGTYLGCKYGIPQMRETGRGGSIVNVSSIAAVRVGRGASDAYTAAKGGVMAMTRTLAVEHAQYGIRCNCLVPGAIATPMVGEITPDMEKWARRNIPMMRWGRPEDVAHMALFLASEEASWITGQFFVVDGGYTAV
jgi:NAD(P)-dependent dehydrogenase (short-subunit alcohol dehydrogenase family)